MFAGTKCRIYKRNLLGEGFFFRSDFGLRMEDYGFLPAEAIAKEGRMADYGCLPAETPVLSLSKESGGGSDDRLRMTDYGFRI